jgi:signal transduction histidine kinase
MPDDRAILANRTTAVLFMSELLLDGAYGPLDPRQQEIVQKLVEAAQDLKDLIRANRQTSFFD